MDSKPPLLSPRLSVVLRPPSLSLISWSGKSWNPRQESNEPSRSHKQVCAQDNVCDLTTTHSNGWFLTDIDRENSVTKLCPVGRGTQPLTPTNTHTISLLGLHFPFTIFHIPVLTMVLDHSQVIPYYTMIREPMYPSWVPQNTRLAGTPGLSKTNQPLSCQGV